MESYLTISGIVGVKFKFIQPTESVWSRISCLVRELQVIHDDLDLDDEPGVFCGTSDAILDLLRFLIEKDYNEQMEDSERNYDFEYLVSAVPAESGDSYDVVVIWLRMFGRWANSPSLYSASNVIRTSEHELTLATSHTDDVLPIRFQPLVVKLPPPEP